MTDPGRPVDHSLGYRVTDPNPAQRLKAMVKGALGLRGVRTVNIVAGPARGARMTLDFSGHTPMYLGMYEWELHKFFHRAVEGASVVFDVGGYIGYDALMLATNCPGRVISFEPDQHQRSLLSDNVAQNPELAPRITISPKAVAAAENAEATTLDAAAEEFGKPDFIKLDIDGGEADALRGGEALFRTHRPHLVVETHSLALEQECGRLLGDFGYRPVIKHNRTVWREQRAGAEHNRWLLAEGSPREGR